jgi:hypothetical protein
MRCPECSQRNSVAAKACYSCGHKFKRKPLPISLKIAFAVTGLIIVAWGAIAAILPSFTDPKNALARIAKKVAEGPKSESEANSVKNEFDEAVRNFLKQNGTQPPAQLSKTLQQALADSAFEVHVFELPRGLEVVEIDTILQASDYLILKTSSNIEVSAVPGMEVFDAAKIITEGAAPSLVMIGHTGGQGTHRPLIKVFALLPDHVIDQTAKSVPELKTEGTATFARNGRNVNIDYSVVAVGQGDKSFSPALKLPQGLSDETIHGSLKWVDGHYQPQLSGGGTGQISLLYAAARLLSGAPAAQYSKALGQIATDLATTGSDAVPQECTISLGQAPAAAPAPERRHHRSQPAAPSPTFYILQGKTLSCGLALDRSSGQWTIISAMKKPTQAQPALAQGTTDPNAMTATTTTATSTTPDGLVESKSPDDKIVTAKGSAPGMTEPTTSPTDVKSTSTATAATSSTKDTKSGAQTTASTSETVEQAKKVLDKISMVQSKGSATESEPPKKGADKTTEPDADKTASDTSKDKKGDKGKSESAVGISASVSDKIEVSAVRMRSGPGSRYAPITTIARGTKIKVIGKTSGWYKVRVNGKDGYVYGGFIDYKTPDAYETLTVEKAGQLTDDHSNKVYASKPGERLVVLGGSKDGKVRVQLSSGQTAYINKESVEKKDEKEETPQFVP